MTFSLRKKRRTTRPAKSTPSRTACRLLAAAAVLALAGSAAAQVPGGQARSSFRPRTDGPPAGPSTHLVLPVQAKTAPGPQPGKTPAPVTPGKVDPGMSTPGVPPISPIPMQPGKETPPGKLPGGPTAPVPGIAVPGAPAGTGAGSDAGSGARPDPYEAYIRLEPPGKERLFGNRDTERELEERMRQERKDAGSPDPVVFPEKPDLTTEPYQTRRHAPTVVLAEPSYVVYQPLYFEEKNAERYGWDLGPVQPVVSTLYFLKDVLCLPHNCLAYPHHRFETSAGQCWPGDPVPYLCYPPELTGSGLLAETGLIYLLYVAIP